MPVHTFDIIPDDGEQKPEKGERDNHDKLPPHPTGEDVDVGIIPVTPTTPRDKYPNPTPWKIPTLD